MAALVWDQVGDRYYETGTKKGVVYPYNTTSKAYDTGVAWNGLTAFTESPSGAEETALYADDIKYGSMRSAEEYGFTIEAYTYPDEFARLDGTESPELLEPSEKDRLQFFSRTSCKTKIFLLLRRHWFRCY